MTFSIAIIGRPNVGKSTLFNRLAGKKLAIVDDTPGVTRDWREAEGTLYNRKVRLIDTAGLEETFDDSIEGRMRRQTEEAMKQADAILFLIDGREGLTPTDEHFARWVRKQKKPVVLGVNKAENDRAVMAGMAEAYSLGFGEPVPLSAEHGIGMHDLYEMFSDIWPEEAKNNDDDNEYEFSDEKIDLIEGDLEYEFIDKDEDTAEKPIKIAIAGRPNVGKSTLVNSLLKENRVMTGPEAGITRDAIAIDWTFRDRTIKLVDTAGLRKKAQVASGRGAERIERMAIDDTMRAMRLAQVVILVLDANDMLEKQDLQIADHILNEGRAMIIAVNKWDTIENKDEALALLNYKLETSLAQVRKIPTVTISAINGKNLGILMDTVLKTYGLWNERVPTGRLNRWLAAKESQHPAPLVNGRQNRMKYIAQINTRPPTFALWCSVPQKLPDAYKRYIANGLREDFGLPGIPVRLLTRASKNPFRK